MKREDLPPEVQAALNEQEALGGPPLEEMSAVEARAAFDAGWPILQTPPPGMALSPEWIHFEGEEEHIPAMLWRGADAARLILYLHGGGWVVGSPASHAAICQRFAMACDAFVVCPDYRLAPENPFPAAVNDVLACLKSLPGMAKSLAADAERIVVAGDSAGGNLAAVAALSAASDPELPTLEAQLLFYPNTSAAQNHESYQRFATGFGLTADTMRWFRDCYINTEEDISDWRVSPLLADLTAVIYPPALVALAGADILYDEGRAYTDKLQDAGVTLEVDVWPNRVHGFLSMCRFDPVANEAIVRAAAFLDGLRQ